MKKLFLVLLAAMTFNANAALITLTTDKTEYNVGETINVTVSLTDLFENGVQTFFSSYVTTFDFDTTALSYVDGSITSLMAYGPAMPPMFPFAPALPAELFEGTNNSSEIKGNAFALSADPFSQAGLTTVGLYTLQFVASTAGVNLDVFTFTQSQIVDATVPVGFPQTVATQTAQFTVNQVPAPSTGVLALIGLAALVLKRKKSHA